MTEQFPFLDSLNSIPGVRAGWIERVPDLEIAGDRDRAMQQLRPAHSAAVAKFGGPTAAWWRAEQVHGCDVGVIPGSSQILAPDGLPVVPGVDGLITGGPGQVLSIYAADCGVIWLADRAGGAIGLLHSGRKGTEANILQNALRKMASCFGTQLENVTAVLSPCIRYPDYDVDFASEIHRQADQAGILNFFDCGLNTASDLTRFYSYRRESGKTGRMLALIVRDFLP